MRRNIKFEQLANAFGSIVVTLSGTINEASLEHLKKHPYFSLVTLFDNEILSTAMHPANAFSPIVVIPFPTLIDLILRVRELHGVFAKSIIGPSPRNDNSPISASNVQEIDPIVPKRRE